MEPDVEAFWGDSDYEYWYQFDRDNTYLLFAKILPDTDIKTFTDDQLLEAFKEWMGDCKTEQKLRELCTSEGIQYKFFSY